ncbi:SDR family NAD(P)-dependent oxidoreductase, partial [Thioclava sp. BHET1]
GLTSGRLRLPPVRLIDAARVGEAFRLMQRSGHIGKIVLRAPKLTHAPRRRAEQPDLSGGWLITGGTGGFGLATAEWLARHGADQLWLTSRSGRLDPEAAARLAALGVRVTALAADVTDAAEMQKLIGRIGTELSGVIH